MSAAMSGATTECPVLMQSLLNFYESWVVPTPNDFEDCSKLADAIISNMKCFEQKVGNRSYAHKDYPITILPIFGFIVLQGKTVLDIYIKFRYSWLKYGDPVLMKEGRVAHGPLSWWNIFSGLRVVGVKQLVENAKKEDLKSYYYGINALAMELYEYREGDLPLFI